MKYVIPVISIIGALVAVLSPSIQGFLAIHPELAAILISLNGLLGSIAPQPHK